MAIKYRAEVTENVEALADAGFSIVKVDYVRGYGRNEDEDVVTTSSVRKAVDAILAVDESHLFVTTPLGKSVWVFFVLGNSDGEVICDYCVPTGGAERELMGKIISGIADRRMAV